MLEPPCIIYEPVQATPHQVVCKQEGGGIQGRKGRLEVRGWVRLEVCRTLKHFSQHCRVMETEGTGTE